jgi:hypothetical protein
MWQRKTPNTTVFATLDLVESITRSFQMISKGRKEVDVESCVQTTATVRDSNAKIKLRNGGPMFGPRLQRQIAGAVSCPGWLYRALIMQITDNRGAIVSLELFTP